MLIAWQDDDDDDKYMVILKADTIKKADMIETIKLLTMHKALHPSDYMSRKAKGSGLANIEDSMDESKREPEDCIKTRK